MFIQVWSSWWEAAWQHLSAAGSYSNPRCQSIVASKTRNQQLRQRSARIYIELGFERSEKESGEDANTTHLAFVAGQNSGLFGKSAIFLPQFFLLLSETFRRLQGNMPHKQLQKAKGRTELPVPVGVLELLTWRDDFVDNNVLSPRS